jgi:UDP-glucose 4-epimerase
VRQALCGESITVYGNGQQSRCFGYVGDVVAALARLVRTESALGEVFNLGSDEEVTINELAERVRTAAGSRSPIVHIPYEQAYEEGFEDMQRRVPSLEKARRAIGYAPATKLRQIIESVIEFERSRTARVAHA